MNRGGPRPGSGRPVGARSKISADLRGRLDKILRTEERGLIASLLKSPDDRVRLGLLVALWDRVYGKPAQSLSVQRSSVSVELVLQQLAERRLRAAEAPPLLPSADEGESREG